MKTFSAYSFRHIVLQPTSACNLDCVYCYLPDRRVAKRMHPLVARALAESIEDVPHAVTLLWHGGEPLATGVEHFRLLLEPFERLRQQKRVVHSLQTNGTLITPEWARLLRDYEFRIGVSLDGPEDLNGGRRNWAGRSTFHSVMEGVANLRAISLPFGAIAVINPINVSAPRELYEWFASVGCESLSINIEEREGLNSGAKVLRDVQVRAFWRELFQAWRANPLLRIREFHNVIAWALAVGGSSSCSSNSPLDLWPTVSCSGDVVVLSPELISASEPERQRFIVGNVMRQRLPDIISTCHSAKYVEEYFIGRHACRASCAYFSYCGGGQASNKFFELGSTGGTETEHCRHTRQAVVDVVLERLAIPEQEVASA